ncbi:MAG: hypothetical protein ACM3VY_00455 [Candidatus Bathyarchaeota archaeon]
MNSKHSTVAISPLARARKSRPWLFVRAFLLTLRFTMKNSPNPMLRAIGMRWSTLGSKAFPG